jgi:signal transduction histidine kinase
MTKKLLHKTSGDYLISAVLILIVSAPVFYLVTEQLYIDDADEALMLRKNEFFKFYAPTLKENEISTWNKFNRDIKIKEAKSIVKDTIFYSYYYDSLANENEPYRELNAPIFIDGKPYVYTARINLIETEDLIKSIALLFFIVIALLLIGLLIINKRYSQNLWNPFYAILNYIEAFEIDKATQPVFLTTDIEEFNRLNMSIEKLIEKNTSIFSSQREFIENAAHELQTPLAVFQAQIDTLIQSGDFTEQQYQILNALNENVARLNRLNRNLLLLSKIDNDGFISKREINLQEVIEKQLEFFKEQAVPKNILIATQMQEVVIVKSNPVLAEILISNLLLNAIRHNVSNGHVEIILTANLLTIANSGQPKSLVAEKLFARFSKLNPTEQGNGLGLAIIKKIVDSNNWRIEYSFQKNLHSFSLHF